MRAWWLLCAACLAACAAAAARQAQSTARWTPFVHVRGVVDLSAPRADGSIFITAAGRLETLAPGGAPAPFAPSYGAPPGLEPYIVLSDGRPVRGAGCAWPRGALLALRLSHGDGVTEVSASGTVTKLASLPSAGLEDGIALDSTGRFGGRLLVTQTAHLRTTLYAIDCRGRVAVLVRGAPRVEGGIAVAPPGFGAFAGDLIAPNELSGRIYALTPAGGVRLLAASGVAHGQDIGVESGGFVPARYAAALVADRGTPGNPHPGDNVILRLSAAALARAGVRAGDLLLVTEGGAATIDVRCAAACTVREVATGPPEAHIEGHVVFTG